MFSYGDAALGYQQRPVNLVALTGQIARLLDTYYAKKPHNVALILKAMRLNVKQKDAQRKNLSTAVMFPWKIKTYGVPTRHPKRVCVFKIDYSFPLVLDKETTFTVKYNDPTYKMTDTVETQFKEAQQYTQYTSNKLVTHVCACVIIRAQTDNILTFKHTTSDETYTSGEMTYEGPGSAVLLCPYNTNPKPYKPADVGHNFPTKKTVFVFQAQKLTVRIISQYEVSVEKGPFTKSHIVYPNTLELEDALRNAISHGMIHGRPLEEADAAYERFHRTYSVRQEANAFT